MTTKLASIQLDFRYWMIPELKNIRWAAIPWEEHLKIYDGYTDSQTAERISKRGGFGVKEAIKEYGWKTPVIWVSSQKEYPSSDDDWEKYELVYDTESDAESMSPEELFAEHGTTEREYLDKAMKQVHELIHSRP